MEYSFTVSFTDLMDGRGFSELAEQGVTAICADYAFVESASKARVKACAAELAACGIRIDTAHPRFGRYNSANSPVNQYRAERLLYLEQLKDGLERMSLLGVRAVPIHSGGCCLTGSPVWSLELCAEFIRALAPTATDCGIILALENTFYDLPQMWDGAESWDPDGAENGAAATGPDYRPGRISRVMYDDVGRLRELVDMCGSPNVKACFDAGHAHYLGDLTRDHALLGDRIALYHLHDNNRNNDTHLAPGYGTLDWDALGPLVLGNTAAHPAFIEAQPWMRATPGSMIRETDALLRGGRRGECRRCLVCGHQILTDARGTFCTCPV